MGYVRIMDISSDAYKSIQKMCKGSASAPASYEASASVTDRARMSVSYSYDNENPPIATVKLFVDGIEVKSETIEMASPEFDLTLEHEGDSYSLILQKEKPRLESV